MSNLAQARTKPASVLSTTYLLPSLLATNTAALFALDRLGGIPDWIKTAGALFLAF